MLLVSMDDMPNIPRVLLVTPTKRQISQACPVARVPNSLLRRIPAEGAHCPLATSLDTSATGRSDSPGTGKPR
jgi:hypothetical protein